MLKYIYILSLTVATFTVAGSIENAEEAKRMALQSVRIKFSQTYLDVVQKEISLKYQRPKAGTYVTAVVNGRQISGQIGYRTGAVHIGHHSFPELDLPQFSQTILDRIASAEFKKRIDAEKQASFKHYYEQALTSLRAGETTPAPSRTGVEISASEHTTAGNEYDALVDKMYWLDEKATLSDLSWLYKNHLIIKDKSERGRFMEVLGAGLLMHGKADEYRQFIAGSLPNRVNFESQTLGVCQKCRGLGNNPRNCATCAGTGTCQRARCQNGVQPGPYYQGRQLDTKCGGCNGTGRCLDCKGARRINVRCDACKGTGKLYSQEAVRALYIKSLITFQQNLQLRVAEKSLLIAEGDRGGQGSAFLVKLGGKPYVATNAHVLNGNESLTFKLVSGEKVKCGEILVSHHRDLALFEVSEPDKYAFLGIYNSTSGETTGKYAAVFGNSLGAGVITVLSGRVLGVGPQFVETDIPFVAGNSGSPFLVGTKVVGLATLATWEPPNWTLDGSRFGKVRRFVTRIDNLEADEMKTLDVKKYHEQLSLLDRIKTDWVRVVTELQRNGQKRFDQNQTAILIDCINQISKEKEWSLSQAGEEAKNWQDVLAFVVANYGTNDTSSVTTGNNP